MSIALGVLRVFEAIAGWLETKINKRFDGMRAAA